MKTKFKYRLLNSALLVMLLFSVSSFSQTTKVSGRVVDATTREPLPFVNILFKGTTIGATTDFEGNYSISTTLNVDSIIFSYIGYNKLTRAVKRGVTQVINLGLTEGIELTTVEVLPGENPAHPILRKIIARKDKNNREKLEAYEYELYNKVEFDLNNLSEDFKSNKLLKPFSFIFDNIDSTNAKEKPYLPIFMTESVSNFYYRKDPKTSNEVILASKVAGLENASVSQFMGDMYQAINIYENNILVFGKYFVSPISDNALFFYKFYLIDSMVIDGHKCYQLQFKPKRKQELTFTGNLWAADTAFAIMQIEMSIADDANINFINTTAVVQKFTNVDSAWMMQNERLVIDFNPFPVNAKKTSLMGIYGRKTADYSKFKINQLKEPQFYSVTENLKVADDALDKDEAFWIENRHDTLSKNEKQIYKMVDTLQTLPAYKNWATLIETFVTGYKVQGNFEYGPYYNVYSYNKIEGSRFRVGLRTSNQFSKWYELSGYLAYGTRDEKFKYSLGIRSFISKKPRRMVGLYYKDDYEVLGQSQSGLSTDNLFTSLFRTTPLTSLTHVKQTNTYIEREWFSGFKTKLSFYNRILLPIYDTTQFDYQNPSNYISPTQSITTSEIRFGIRFAYQEKYIDGAFTRTSLGTHYPILQTQYTLGIKNFFGGDYNYHKLTVGVDDRIRINPIGYFDYTIVVGKIWKPIPYPLLEIPPGNQTYVYDPSTYNGMNYNEFVNDEYAMAAISHHFDGFFLNKIPLMRRLKWREVVGGKALIGRTSTANEEILAIPSNVNVLNSGPYMEVTAGIENILKIFRIDAVWRLSYLNQPNVQRIRIKASMQFTF